MKRIIVVLLLISLALAANAADARIVSISGTVEVREPGSSWAPVSPGQIISTDSWISTGFGSRAKLSVGGMELNLQPLTRVSITSLSDDRSSSGSPVTRTNVSLQTGRVRASRPPATRATRRSIDFRVSTPVATAAVRGTDFELSFDKLVTYEGLVSFSQGGALVMSPGGTYTFAVDGERPLDPIALAIGLWGVSPQAGSIPGDGGRSGGRSQSTSIYGDLKIDLD